MRPFFTQADIERLYRDPDATRVELSPEQIEHHIRRGRMMRAQMAAELFGAAGRGIKRLFGGAGNRQTADHAQLTPSNV